jgi:glycosyltransferase involved in cell wall biosynthesis
MLIAFVHNSKAFLPEIAAYTNYFTRMGSRCEVTDGRRLHKLQPTVAWHFMGIDRQKKQEGIFTIHEYVSASTPPAARLKNAVKRMISVQPDHRVFQNEYVKNALGFNDGVAHSYRDMGIPAHWLEPPDERKEFDFIYTGELWQRGLDRVLHAFAYGAMKTHSLLIVSRDYQQVSDSLKDVKNIVFAGPVPHDEVRTLIAKSRFALNIMPDAAPFNRQTSTKLLEYCACRVPVITSDYEWVRKFARANGGNFFFLTKELANFSWENITRFNYSFPDLGKWTWEQQIQRSGIPALLAKKFPELKAADA